MSEKQSVVKLSDEIISLIVMEAVTQVSGVNQLTDSLADNLTKKIIGKGDIYKGIKISKDKEDMYVIDVHIIADYGKNPSNNKNCNFINISQLKNKGR